MLPKVFTRFFHIHSSCWAAEKSLLASLRKKTGYTFTNCKKALQLHQNNLVEAEKWLNQQALSLGWSKATKLEGRQTTQGLVAVTVNNRNAAIVEINCETDFVAKNATFQEMAEIVANACLNFAEKRPYLEGSVTKINLDSNELRELPTSNGKLLIDRLALMIGSLGENATLRRALCYKVDNGIHLSAYAHPSGTERNNILLGRVGGLVALKQKEVKEVDLEILGRNLSQHVVGMNPKKIGTLDDNPASNTDEETCLIHQEFIVDDTITVKEVLDINSLEVIDFIRFECGQNIESDYVHPLSSVETCQ